MHKSGFTLLFIFFAILCEAQLPNLTEQDSLKTVDSLKRVEYLRYLGNGYVPTKYFNFDIRYLLKFNQYEGIRLGLGGTTNAKFSEKLRLGGYLAYGFKDHNFKFGINGATRVNHKKNTWLKASYVNDLQETASTVFIADGRIFQFFEPRLLNIDLFYHHKTTALGIQHNINPYLVSELSLSSSSIEPTYDYLYFINNRFYENYHLTSLVFSLQYSPFSKFEDKSGRSQETHMGYPKFSLQATKSFSNVFDSDFDIFKLDFKTLFKLPYPSMAETQLTLTSGIAWGEAPLTHLYHAYPNNINKETILQRFTVAGLNSFETMYFNEFFSDKFLTLQGKHYLKPFEISSRFKPQLVLISRFAIGTMDHLDRHIGFTFNTLDKGYFESGIELNKLLLGFGLSFSYRYGGYHLPHEADNLALKFTFNITL